jgi:hypothetical protein
MVYSMSKVVCFYVNQATFFVTFFSATIDGENLIVGHKLHIGTPYRGKRFWTRVTNLHYLFIYYILDNLIWLYFPIDLVPFGASAPLFLRNGELLGHSPIRNEPSPMNIHVLYLTIVILKLPVPHFT